MFYPFLTRHKPEEYHNRNGKFYESYAENLPKISIDCKSRCIYCDVLISEIGHEGIQIDHFRPQFHFAALKSHPLNLCLACQKCNRLKSNDWPCEKEVDKPSHNNGIGYLDPFVDEVATYVSIDAGGYIHAVKAPAQYIINKLLLNRPGRVQIRRQRLFEARRKEVFNKIINIMDSLISTINSDQCSKEECLQKLKILREMMNSIRQDIP